MHEPVASRATRFWWAALPFIFVVIWSTGFIVAKYATPHAPPLTFLLYRYAGVVLVLLPVVFFTGARWPESLREWRDIAIVGVLLQAIYLGGVWVAIAKGMPAGVSALLVGVQPLATAAFAFTVAERATRLQWLGLIAGFVGIALVLSDRLTLAGVGGVALAGQPAGARRHHGRHALSEAPCHACRPAHSQRDPVRRLVPGHASGGARHRVAASAVQRRVLAGARLVDRRAVASSHHAAAGYDSARSRDRGGEPDVPDAADDCVTCLADLR
jgi:hypothetical protein